MSSRLHDLIAAGAIFYCSHSGGKDSQAMYAYLRTVIPHDRIVVVHADLGEIEWLGVQDHIHATIQHSLNVVKAIWKDGSEKTLLSMVEKRFEDRPESPSWPSSAARYCTSDLKRGPIEKFIRGDLKARGKTLAVNVMGLRAEESQARAKRAEWTVNKRLSVAGREVYDWLPILKWLVVEVFRYIRQAGQVPFWAYAAGNERLSCVFCIFGSPGDIAHGARVRPGLLARYAEIERRIGYTIFAKESLQERVVRGQLIATDQSVPAQMELYA